MQLKYSLTVLEGQGSDSKICSLCWSPNNKKLAVATSDRQILLFDENGQRRDKFSTKPFNPASGKKSYIIKAIAFSPDSTKLAVGQTDNIIYIYKIGENWGDKKAICNKFPQSSSVTCLTWLSTGPIICGLADGKVRHLILKTNKSQSLFASDSLVVSLAPNSKGSGFLSGHADGNIIRYFVTADQNENESQGRVILVSVPPTALAWAHGYIFAAGCDMKVSIYNNNGKLIKVFDYMKDFEHEFTQAVCSPSGQAVLIGSFNRLHLFLWNNRKSLWEETTLKQIENLYTVTALAWKKDGSKVVCGGLCGAVLMFESVLRRTVWRDKFEITYVGPNQVLVKSLNSSKKDVIMKSQHGGEIDDVKIMGHDSYLVARTENTLIVAALERNLLSEVSWDNTARLEKFYFENPTVCIIFNSGELSLIEYGENEVLCSVRTEFANPHLMSVRLNERNQSIENKKLAYLLDLKTICVLDLVNGVTVSQITNDSKIDWLELNDLGQKLLFRDKKQRLILSNILTHTKQTIFTGVSFVQWVEGSDVAVAQAGNNLVIWYNIDMPENATIVPLKGDVTDVVRGNGKTEAICLHGNNTITTELDEGLVEFGTALNDSDYSRAVLFLESMGMSPEARAMWNNLSLIALKQQNLMFAERCEAALGNIASAHFLHETSVIGQKYAEKFNDYNTNSPEVHARLSILEGDLSTAENIYLEQGNIEGALEMYTKLYKWNQALRYFYGSGYKRQDQTIEQAVLMEMIEYLEPKCLQVNGRDLDIPYMYLAPELISLV